MVKHYDRQVLRYDIERNRARQPICRRICSISKNGGNDMIDTNDRVLELLSHGDGKYTLQEIFDGIKYDKSIDVLAFRLRVLLDKKEVFMVGDKYTLKEPMEPQEPPEEDQMRYKLTPKEKAHRGHPKLQEKPLDFLTNDAHKELLEPKKLKEASWYDKLKSMRTDEFCEVIRAIHRITKEMIE